MGSGAFLVEAARQLGEHLRRAWDLHKNTPNIPPDEDPDLHARRLVAQQCLYGVDKNPFAVDLAKLSLWLVTLAKDHPFTFLDHALKHGDSLVGLNKGQIAEFRWDHETRLHGPLFEHFKKQVGKATALRREIQQLGDDQDAAKRSTLKNADDAIHEARLIGDAAIHAFFSEDSDKKRNQRREELYKETVHPAQKGDARAINRLEQLSAELRSGDKPVSPFHWEIEFPEVFDRENPGFDCFVGNPPFMGGARISTVNSRRYLDILYTSYSDSGDRMDLVAYFLRRSFALIRQNGTFGLIATNTVAQGDTRAGGLRWICRNKGTVYAATRRLKWPGNAAVVVSLLHCIKASMVASPSILDNKEVPRISAFLFHTGGDDNPEHLRANASLSFKGAEIYGEGFLFADDNEGSTPLARMRQLIDSNPRNAERIRPFIGGAEINESPTQTPHRYVINFGSMSEQEAERWPQLLDILREKVRPGRMTKAKDVAQAPWWQFWRVRQELSRVMSTIPRVLVASLVSKHLSFAFMPTTMIFSHKTVVIPLVDSLSFGVLQSRIHEIWSRFFSSTLEDRLNYSPSDCFETFPFPENWQQSEPLERIGERYYTYRADLMVRNNEGLTATYNRFHDPDEPSPDILKLRELHSEMDRAVLTAYGWSDLAERATCEFRLDYEDDDAPADDDAPRARTRKRPWRYRWPQDFHDEVLARLLDLNQQRAEQERLAGLAAAPKPKPAKKAAKKASKRATRAAPGTQTALLPPDDD